MRVSVWWLPGLLALAVALPVAAEPAPPDPAWRLERTLSGHDSLARCAAWSPDGRVLATGGADRTLRLHDVARGVETDRIVLPQGVG